MIIGRCLRGYWDGLSGLLIITRLLLLHVLINHERRCLTPCLPLNHIASVVHTHVLTTLNITLQIE